MSNQMSLLHFRKTSASRTASNILALRACVLSFNEARTTRLRPSLGTASPSTCGLHRCPEIHLRKNLKLIYLAASALEVFCNWALYKLTYSFIHSWLSYKFSSLVGPPLYDTWENTCDRYVWKRITRCAKVLNLLHSASLALLSAYI